MRAWTLQDAPGLDALRLGERPEPEPGPGEALIAVRAVSLNFPDLLVATGRYAGGTRPVGRIPVSDGAGEVVAIGPGVTQVEVGCRVVAAFMPGWLDGPLTAAKQATSLGGAGADGMLAERVALPASALVRFPAHLSFEEAATLPCAGVTAWYALFEGAALRPGETVLLLGTGGVSVFALQLAKLAGARVIITTSSPAKVDRIRALGADEVIDTSAAPDWQERVLALTGGRGADLAVEVGGPGTLNRTLQAVRFGGRISLMGVLSGLSDRVDTGVILHKNTRIQGTYVGSVAMLERLVAAVGASGLRPVIDRVFAFEQAPAADAHLDSGAHLGKVVIRIAGWSRGSQTRSQLPNGSISSITRAPHGASSMPRRIEASGRALGSRCSASSASVWISTAAPGQASP